MPQKTPPFPDPKIQRGPYRPFTCDRGDVASVYGSLANGLDADDLELKGIGECRNFGGIPVGNERLSMGRVITAIMSSSIPVGRNVCSWNF